MTYCNCRFFAYHRRNKSEENAATGDAQPESCNSHAAGKRATVAYLHHEDHCPSAQSDFNADVNEQEERADPSHPSIGLLEKSTFQATMFAVIGVIARSSGDRSIIPEGDGADNSFHSSAHSLYPYEQVAEVVDIGRRYHNSVKVEPRNIGLGYQSGHDQWA